VRASPVLNIKNGSVGTAHILRTVQIEEIVIKQIEGRSGVGAQVFKDMNFAIELLNEDTGLKGAFLKHHFFSISVR